MNKNRFNLRRCWSLLIGDLRNNHKDILLLAGVAFLVFIGVAIFSVFTPTMTMTSVPGMTISAVQAAAISALSNLGLATTVAEAVIFSRVFANMSTRSGEVSYLMLPATNSEKWLSRVAYVLLVGGVLILAIYYVSLYCCGLIGRLFDMESLALLPSLDNNYFTEMFHFDMPKNINLINALSSFFFAAAFILGGTYFRRLPWLYTALILLATLFVILVVVGGFGMHYLLDGNAQLQLKEAAQAGQLNEMFNIMMPWLYTVSIVCGVLGVVMLWLSYRLFCRRQLEARKIRFIVK